MNRFWDSIIRPIIEKIDARYIVEIGSESGINTKNILDYCHDHDARMTAIDPAPLFDVDEFKKEYGNKFEMREGLSLSILPLLTDYDIILIDGDHNWYTVFNELKIIEKSFKGKKFPLIFFHDVGWPYARRDLYYNPENIPEVYRQPYKKLGIYPGQTDLKEKGGLNRSFYNAIYENNLHNGVLTAIEDFIDESDLKFSLNVINMFNGLGILYPKNKEIDQTLKRYVEPSNLLNILEMERLKLYIAYLGLKETRMRIENQLNELKDEKSELEVVIADSTGYADLLENKLCDLEGEKAKLTDAYGLLENKLCDLEGEKAKLTDAYGLLENSLNDLKSQKLDLEVAYKKIKDQNNLLEEDLDMLKGEKTSLQVEVNQLKTLQHKLVTEKGIYLNIVKKRENQLNELKSQIDIFASAFFELKYESKVGRTITQRLISLFPGLYILFKNDNRFKNILINIRGYNAIKRNNLVDVGFYLKSYPDVRQSGMDPILHYIYKGFKEGRKPNPTFDGDYYIKTHKDVKNSNINPLVHYSLYGINEEKNSE